jgi:hypothetical protein
MTEHRITYWAEVVLQQQESSGRDWLLREVNEAAVELEQAQQRFEQRVRDATSRYALMVLEDAMAAQRQERLPIPPRAPHKEPISNGGEEKLPPITFHEPKKEEPAPAPKKTPEPPAPEKKRVSPLPPEPGDEGDKGKPTKPKLTPEVEALTVYNVVGEGTEVGHKWSFDTFRGSIRQALQLGRIGEERLAAIIEAGVKAYYWHKVMEGGKEFVVFGPRPAGKRREAAEGTVDQEHQAGSKLADAVTDWELEFTELYTEKKGKTQHYVDTLLDGFYGAAGVDSSISLELQRRERVEKLRDSLMNKVMALREELEHEEQEKQLAGEA